MSTIEMLQNRLYQALFDKPNNLDDWTASSYPLERLRVYSNTIFYTLSHALAETYPGISALVGEACMKQLTHAFCRNPENLPVSGCLDDWGREFADFIEGQAALSDWPYLSDYARYEWLKHQSYCAVTSQALADTAFATVSEAMIESLVVTFIPSVAFIASQYDLRAIEALFSNPQPKPLHGVLKRSNAIIRRYNGVIQTLWIDDDHWLFLLSLKQGLKLGDALAKTVNSYPYFEVTTAIQLMLSQKLIGSFTER